MNFNKHFDLEGQHAFLSASKYHWIRYDEEKLISIYNKHMAAQRGSELHAFARRAIDLGIKLPKSNKTLNMYVNDAIGFKMVTEQLLFYSLNCFGTADTISFRQNILRIFDLKTGESPASMDQLEIYAAIFCLEYDFKPVDIGTELRLYQSNEVLVHSPDSNKIEYIMDKIVRFDKRIKEVTLGG